MLEYTHTHTHTQEWLHPATAFFRGKMPTWKIAEKANILYLPTKIASHSLLPHIEWSEESRPETQPSQTELSQAKRNRFTAVIHVNRTEKEKTNNYYKWSNKERRNKNQLESPLSKYFVWKRYRKHINHGRTKRDADDEDGDDDYDECQQSRWGKNPTEKPNN